VPVIWKTCRGRIAAEKPSPTNPWRLLQVVDAFQSGVVPQTMTGGLEYREIFTLPSRWCCDHRLRSHFSIAK
jgi:hypothetical protein